MIEICLNPDNDTIGGEVFDTVEGGRSVAGCTVLLGRDSHCVSCFFLLFCGRLLRDRAECVWAFLSTMS